MWLAKDKDGLCVYEHKPYKSDSMWCIESGFYFQVPDNFAHEYLGRAISFSTDPIEIDFKISKK